MAAALSYRDLRDMFLDLLGRMAIQDVADEDGVADIMQEYAELAQTLDNHPTLRGNVRLGRLQTQALVGLMHMVLGTVQLVAAAGQQQQE